LKKAKKSTMISKWLKLILWKWWGSRKISGKRPRRKNKS